MVPFKYGIARAASILCMPDQNLDPAQPTATAPAPQSIQPMPPAPSIAQPPQRLPYWLQQAERLLRVIVRMYLGLLVCCAPWYSAAWDNNPLFVSNPNLLNFVTNGAVRGIVSGLGLLNLWIALRDALRPLPDPTPAPGPAPEHNPR
jgi:hypothetical protein